MDNLEDQVRRMIVSGDPPPPLPYHRNADDARQLQMPRDHFLATNERFLNPGNPGSYSQPHPSNNGSLTPFPPGLASMNGLPPNHHSIQSNHGRMQSHHMMPNAGVQHDPRYHANSNVRSMPPSGPPQIDPTSFQRFQDMPRPEANRSLRSMSQHPQYYNENQSQYLQSLIAHEIPPIEMGWAERQEKDAFRTHLQAVLDSICAAAPGRFPTISLQEFGSSRTGFATAGSDMDLVIVSQDDHIPSECFSLHEHSLPRTLEKVLLDAGYGARLLTRTRVPIIKICQSPTPELLEKMREEREKWDQLPEEEKYPSNNQEASNDADIKPNPTQNTPADGVAASGEIDASTPSASTAAVVPSQGEDGATKEGVDNTGHAVEVQTGDQPAQKRAEPKPWTRQRAAGPLDFPSSGVGIQCDINFFNPLGLHNTQLLRCYALCDSRVYLMVIFVKNWAKKRKINSSYSGTLSSYGYVLMVLHYLMNVVQPPVLPNLQGPWRPPGNYTPHGVGRIEVDGWNVDFWRNEAEITNAVERGVMTPNHDTVGGLLAGFFHYYSSLGPQPQFHWMQECLSLRSPGGLLRKDEKGWTRATTEEGDGRRVQHRYLFCIEDPFELSHNVARTVTHFGIIAIRDEFRRAHRILHAIGSNYNPRDGHLLAPYVAPDTEATVPIGMSPRHANHRPPQDQGRSVMNQTARAGYATASPSRAQHSRQSPRGPPLHHHQPVMAARAPNLADNEAFPALGPSTPRRPKPRAAAAANTKKGAAAATAQESGNFSEVSGERAKAVLEDLRRRRLEQDAEVTATGAANAVLDGND